MAKKRLPGCKVRVSILMPLNAIFSKIPAIMLKSRFIVKVKKAYYMRYIFRPHLLNTLITLILLSVLVNLGFWQLNRAAKKTLIQAEFESRQHQRIDLKTLNNSSNIA